MSPADIHFSVRLLKRVLTLKTAIINLKKDCPGIVPVSVTVPDKLLQMPLRKIECVASTSDFLTLMY